MSDLSSRRVVITGMGVVCPLGNSTDALWDALSTGRSGVKPLTSLPTEHLPISYGGEARDFRGEIDDFGPLEKKTKRMIKKGLNVMCREIAMGVAAAQFALADAGLTVDRYDPQRIGASYGSDYIMTLPDEFTAGIRNCLDEDGNFDFSRWADKGMPEVTPLWLLKYLPNMPASHVAIYNDLQGPSNSITLREASANLAIGEAYWTIMRGAADIMVAGATGTRIHPLRTVHVVLQEQLADGDVAPEKASRPFDKDRTGMVLGEGAGTIILEDLDHAQQRGANILAEVVAHASSTVLDRHCVAKVEEALKNVIVQCLRAAQLEPPQLGHIHAHGLSTRRCDIDEAKAIRDVFGAPADAVPVTAAKSYFGNLGAGSGVVELIASVLALTKDALFPILNYETPDPQCAVAVADQDRSDPGTSFLNLNVTPQGQASGILVRRI